MGFCRSRGVRHLIHISSCSVYKNSIRHIDEEASVATNPSKKGSYGAIKLVGEGLLATKSPAELKISMIRPGLILGEGMGGYMGGIGLRMPFNQIVGLGSARSLLPVAFLGIQIGIRPDGDFVNTFIASMAIAAGLFVMLRVLSILDRKQNRDNGSLTVWPAFRKRA